MSCTRHVIIGNSAAGLNAAKAIRQVDHDAEIIILSAQDGMAYSPVVLPYLVSGNIREERMYITDTDFYRQNCIDLRLCTKAEGLDTKARQVHLQNGVRLDYDRLLIATGASARRLSIDTSSVRDRVFVLRTMADARAIAKASEGAKDVLMIGAGLVGLETGYALEKKGKQVTLLAKSNQLLSRNADARCARMIQKKMEGRGIRFMFGRDVVGLERVNGRIRVQTDQKDHFFVDFIVVGKGVDPNLGLVQGTDIDTEWGIRVKLDMQTSVPGVYAAGDVAQARHLLSGKSETFGNWPSACLEGRVAGMNMAGKVHKLAGELAYNMMPVFGLTAAFMERRDDGDDQTEALLYEDPRRWIYRKILIKNDLIVGAVMLESYQDAGVLLYLLRKRKNVASLRGSLPGGQLAWGQLIRR